LIAQYACEGLNFPLGGFVFHYDAAYISNWNCCVVPGLAEHTSGRKPTFYLHDLFADIAG
jgi:hypothetical protein